MHWPAYVRKINQFILMNDIKDNLKIATLITLVGELTYTTMCDLCAPDHTKVKIYDQLVKVVTDHMEPQRSEIAESHVFRLRRQKAEESLSE
ncbi:hypothetical protein EVAR_66371_1 [Eumeta japonica]|uniref:Uncharacterized protein n=1 Tax=Eumeta variegata TaxID=151549 RepID=A0A4C1ZKR0_EUMVA|nr:hypothetical protein EVAR_66371_1 [Eumeta japonica]